MENQTNEKQVDEKDVIEQSHKIMENLTETVSNEEFSQMSFEENNELSLSSSTNDEQQMEVNDSNSTTGDSKKHKSSIEQETSINLPNYLNLIQRQAESDIKSVNELIPKEEVQAAVMLSNQEKKLEEAENLCTKNTNAEEQTLTENKQALVLTKISEQYKEQQQEEAEDLCTKTTTTNVHNEYTSKSLNKNVEFNNICQSNSVCAIEEVKNFDKNESKLQITMEEKHDTTNLSKLSEFAKNVYKTSTSNETELLNLSLSQQNKASESDVENNKIIDLSEHFMHSKKNNMFQEVNDVDKRKVISPTMNGDNEISAGVKENLNNSENLFKQSTNNLEKLQKEITDDSQNSENVMKTIENSDTTHESSEQKISYPVTDSISEKLSAQNQLNNIKINKLESSAHHVNESHYSSTESLNSSSTFRSSSSHQLIIDQATEEEKVPPLRLKLKRKLSKSNSSTDETIPAKKMNTNDDAYFEQTGTHFDTENVFKESENFYSSDLNNLVDLSKPLPIDSSKNTENLQNWSAELNNVDIPSTTSEKDENIDKITETRKMTETLNLADSVETPINSLKSPTTQYYKCTRCGTYHESWSFFLHLQEKHDRFLCLYCIKCFRTAEKLALHLEIRHDLEQNHFNSEEAFRKSGLIIHGFLLETRFLMCCTCQYIFRESAAFTEHVCVDLMKSCELCGQKGRHANQCKANPIVKRRNKKNIRQKTKQSVEPTIPASEPPPPPPPPPPAPSLPLPLTNDIITQNQLGENKIFKPQSEDSNSSSNMVIDESCNTNHSVPNQINPFKELDESERMDQEAELINTTNLLVNTETPNKNVFKFKLRVPKEFQKPVDEVISTSDESEHGAFEDEMNETTNQITMDDNTQQQEQQNSNLPIETNNVDSRLNNSATAVDYEHDESEEEESIEEGVANSHLERILKEIEQTKLDIEKTKETIHQRTHKNTEMLQENNVGVGEQENTLEQVAETVEADYAEKHEKKWAITPPATPNLNNVPKFESSTLSENQNTEHAQQTADNLEHLNVVKITESENLTATNFEENKQQNVEFRIESKETTQMEDKAKDEMPSEIEQQQFAEAHNNNNNNNINTNTQAQQEAAHSAAQEPTKPPPPDDGIEVANEDTLIIELQLEQSLDKFEIVEFVRKCLKAAYPYCLYCNHARRIAVNGESLVLHLLAQHRFTATVDSITAEELQPSTLITKLKSFLPTLKNVYMNSNSYCTIGDGRFTQPFNERIFECFQCRFVTTTHKELYLHNRKMHLRTAILCFMCRCNFYSFSEILCHICPGASHKVSMFEIKYRCCLCELENIPSPFRLMVHLRKRHFACDVCLEDCRDQSKLSSHVWKHKLHHLCYRCGIAYRNKLDITKHLFWKHGTESAICKRCLNKRWPHVYHFCVPATTFSCEVCQLSFSKAMYLNVHKRLHTNDYRYPCTEDNCEAKFISRKLLLKHAAEVHKPNELRVDEIEQKPANAAERVEPKTENENSVLNQVKLSEEENENEVDNKQAKKVECSEKLGSETFEAANENKSVQPAPAPSTQNENETKMVIVDKKPHEKQHKKKKRRAKESLEDLNLIAPNLSESGSSSESEESETKSTKLETGTTPCLRSPLYAQEDGKIPTDTELSENTGKVLEIWKNFLQAQQQQACNNTVHSVIQQFTEYTEDDYPEPKCLHVCISDHDYCAMFKKNTNAKESANNGVATSLLESSKKHHNNSSRRTSSGRHSNNNSSTSDDDDESSDTSSSSSCSCGSNCSCSNNGAGSTSSSSSDSHESENSDSSLASKKKLRKKSEHSNRHHKKSVSLSPMKNHQVTENLNVCSDTHENMLEKMAEKETDVSVVGGVVLEPSFNESDLETAESETDEEYYDEHPQKLATELLSQKRAQLMARTLLSPSHNYDIVENSRPSTPSLPEDVVYERRKKKKKRERKSTVSKTEQNTQLSQFIIPQGDSTTTTTTTSGIITEQLYNVAHCNTQFVNNNTSNTLETVDTISMAQQILRLPIPAAAASSSQQSNFNFMPRMSDSSCSDTADNSLKRSKRTRRPNKFYGYTSDDESMASAALGQSLVIGMRTYKPQPPPQLVWDKEDLPVPSKSILNIKKPARVSRQQEPQQQQFSANNNASLNADSEFNTKKKRRSTSLQRTQHNRKRIVKNVFDRQKLPPIPRLKIRPVFYKMSNETKTYDHDTSRELDVEDDDSSDASSDNEQTQQQTLCNKFFPPNQTYATDATILPSHYPPQPTVSVPVVLPSILPPALPPPPPPQTATAFNRKIPPALLPNPDFSTLQYFKANNIRYPIRPPAGARAAREGESVYCYCRCPYDEVSEMIACDGDNCLIEWFHFECVGIMVAPQGKWFCAECRPQYSEELYPTTANTTANLTREQ